MSRLAVMLPLLLAGCFASAPVTAIDIAGTASGSYVLPITSLKEAKFKATVRQQYDYSCGSAALATLLTHHYGYPVTEQAVFGDMFDRGDQAKIQREGFSLLDMKLYLQTHGFKADGFELPLDKLLESGLPAIVLIDERGYHHFVVVKGLRDGRVLLGDPSSGARTLTRLRIEAIWANKLLFVIHSQQSLARFNVEAEWQLVPSAPFGTGLQQDGLGARTLGKLGPGDF